MLYRSVGVSSEPQHKQLELTPADKVLVLASDGECAAAEDSLSGQQEVSIAWLAPLWIHLVDSSILGVLTLRAMVVGL
jgi:hypothetical protein